MEENWQSGKLTGKVDWFARSLGKGCCPVVYFSWVPVGHKIFLLYCKPCLHFWLSCICCQLQNMQYLCLIRWSLCLIRQTTGWSLIACLFFTTWVMSWVRMCHGPASEEQQWRSNQCVCVILAVLCLLRKQILVLFLDCTESSVWISCFLLCYPVRQRTVWVLTGRRSIKHDILHEIKPHLPYMTCFQSRHTESYVSVVLQMIIQDNIDYC